MLWNKWRWLIFLVLAISLVSLHVWQAGGGFPLDDSWIHQTYGRNLALAGEWALIPGQPSAASTAPLYTVLLAMGYRLGVPYMLWAHALGVLALWGIALVGARYADRAAIESRTAGLFVGMLLVIEWHLVWAAASGMETALFTLWIVLLPLLAWRELDQRPRRTILRGGVFGAVGALAVLTRPEGVVMVALSGLAFLVAIAPQLGWPRATRWIAGAAIGFAVCIAPYLWLNLSLTGGLLPNTSAAKQAQHAPLLALSYPRRLWMMIVPPFVGGQLLLLPGMVGFVTILLQRSTPFSRKVFGLLPLVWSLALIALYAARLPAAYQHGRYVIPAIPGLVIAGGVGALWLLSLGRRSRMGRVFSRVIVIAGGLMFVVMAVFVSPGVYARDVAIIDQEMVTAALWLGENIPPDELLAVHDIGAVAYFTPRPILDIAGLVSPEVIPIVNDADALWALMQARSARYLMAFPDQIPGDDPTDPRLCEVFNTGGTAAPQAGGENMTIYQLAWDQDCGTTVLLR